MNDFQIATDIAAPIERVWAATLDIERWPQWTPTVSRAKVLDPGPVAVGSKVRISQPTAARHLGRAGAGAGPHGHVTQRHAGHVGDGPAPT